MKRNVVWLLCLMLLGGCRAGSENRLSTLDEVAAVFSVPPDSTRTKVWWFHGETETTREGITADLEAYRRAGVGGVVYYDQVHNKKTPRALDAFSPEWWEMLIFSAREAERLGLTFECHVSNGYVAGGPWITPEMGMQRVAAVDTVLVGGQSVEVKLPRPSSSYYKDIAVLAFPASSAGREDSRSLRPRVSSNLPTLPVESLFRPGVKLTSIPVPEKGTSVYVYLDFGREFTARSLTYQVAPRGKATTSATNVPGPPADTFVGTGYQVLPPLGQLEVSDDGRHYRPVCDLLPVYRAHSSWKQKTVSFPVVTARYFRLNLHDWTTPDKPRLAMQLGDVCLSSKAAVDCWEEKSGLYAEYIEAGATPHYSRSEVIDTASVIDLTALLDDDGMLRWQAPEGLWTVLRVTHVPTGSKTKHGRPNLLGLECDKMSVEAAECQWRHYFGAIADTLTRHGIALQGMAMDSHEAGSQNWTPGFDREFRARRGYDLKKYLPVMAGYVVGSSQESEAFLYDVRRTVADLIADNYYATFDRLCRERGLDFTAQATGNALCIVADPIQAKGRVAKPQGEFWAIHPDGNYDIKECSSAAHLYAKPIASGEAFTDAKFAHSPAYLKSLADYAYCFGINEFVVCASAYQPWLDSVPGNTGGGRHYCLNRNNTFWPYSRPFWDYQARCAYLMRQGRPVVDLAVYLGENAPVKILTYRLPEIPSGYDFDAFTSDALFRRMEVRDGRVVLPDGMSYRMVILPRNGELTLAALKKIASFVEAGVPVYGPRPTGSPTHVDRDCDEEYRRWVAALWGETPVSQGRRSYGRGTVYWGMPLHEAVAEAGFTPDLALMHGDVKKGKLYFTHRRLADADIYFLDNHTQWPLSDTIIFRSAYRQAQLWNPVDGRRYAVPALPMNDGTVALPLELAPREACFVVLADVPSDTLPAARWLCRERVAEVDGPWQVYFDPDKGGPGEVVFHRLTDWTTHADARIRYYSGTALYRGQLAVQRRNARERVCLRFSSLGAVARVVVNGREAGIVWCSPWEVDLTPFVHDGDNVLELYVANSLMNRMIGDALRPADERITYAWPEIVTPTDTLVASGIAGPVSLLYREESR